MYGSRKRTRRKHNENLKHNFNRVKKSIKNKTLELQKEKSSKIQHMLSSIEKLKKKNEKLTGRHNIHDLKDNERDIQRLQKEIEFINDDKPFEEFVEQVTPLLEEGIPTKSQNIEAQQKHAIYVKIFTQDRLPYFVESEHCKQCQVQYKFSSQDCKLVCPKCGGCEDLIYCSSDFVDTIEPKASSPYLRAPLYRKYLMQFHEEAPEIPLNVIEVVYRQLSKVHMMLTTKVKPTPIAAILRDEKLQKWTSFSQKIAKMINNEPISAFSQALIDRLVKRFEKITPAFNKTKDAKRKKIMNFEFLTRQFLYMDNLPHLAENFACHKTRLVLNQADNRLLKCSKKLQEIDEWNWDVSRSC
jgi:hypothetical protein